jgi:hypothetical protein
MAIAQPRAMLIGCPFSVGIGAAAIVSSASSQ